MQKSNNNTQMDHSQGRAPEIAASFLSLLIDHRSSYLLLRRQALSRLVLAVLLISLAASAQSLSPTSPAKEYIYLNSRPIAIEFPAPASGGGVVVTPSVATLSDGEPAALTADQASNWTVSGSGSVNPTSGTATTYQAPASIASASTATVTATKQGAPAVQGTATISLAPVVQPLSASYSSGAAQGQIQVTRRSAAAITVTSLASWVTITAGSSFSGSGSATYSVTANSLTSQRTGQIRVEGKVQGVTEFTKLIDITQAGAPPLPQIAFVDAPGLQLHMAATHNFSVTLNGVPSDHLVTWSIHQPGSYAQGYGYLDQLGFYRAPFVSVASEIIRATYTSGGASTYADYSVTILPAFPPAHHTPYPRSGFGASQNQYLFRSSLPYPESNQPRPTQFLISSDATQADYSCYGWLDASGLFKLKADTGTVWIENPYNLGMLTADRTWENSQCKLMARQGMNPKALTISPEPPGDGMQSLVLDAEFKPSILGGRTVYMRDPDAGWVAVGEYHVTTNGNLPVSAGAVTPAGGKGSAATTFTFTFGHANGRENLNVVNILINSGLSGASACYLAYNRPQHTLYLVGDNGTSLATVPYNSQSATSNSQCGISEFKAIEPPSGVDATKNLTLEMKIQFNTGTFAGGRAIWMAAGDLAGVNTGWQIRGSYFVEHGTTPSPVLDSLTPTSGTGTRKKFTATFRKSAGAPAFTVGRILLNSGLDGVYACWVGATPSGWLQLVNDLGTAGLPSVQQGTSATTENGQCKLYAQESLVAVSGNDLVVTLDLEFKPAFQGPRIVYTDAVAGSGTNWQASGTWWVP